MFTYIKSYEKGLLIKNGKLEKILSTGSYLFFPILGYKLELYDMLINHGQLRHARMMWFYQENPELIRKHFHVIDLGIHEACIIYEKNIPKDLLDGGKTYFYFQGNVQFRSEILDYSESPLLPKNKYQFLKSIIGTHSSKHLSMKTIHEGELGVLIINGKFSQTLTSGEYFFIDKIDTIVVHTLSAKMNTKEINGQEILTKDKYTIRINANLYYTIKNAEAYFISGVDPEAFIYTQAQLALREIIANECFGDLMEKKNSISQELKNYLTPIFSEMGIEVNGFGIKDLILPGDMREIFNKLIIAEKDAQVNTIKRRDEAANVRDMLNHAKLYQEHPMLQKLKELDTLEKIIEKVDVLQVNNGFSGLLDMISINPTSKN